MKYIIKTPEQIVRLHTLVYIGLVTEDGIHFKPPLIRGTMRYFDTLDSTGSIAPVNQEMIDFANSDKIGAQEAREIIGDVFYTYEELLNLNKISEV